MENNVCIDNFTFRGKSIDSLSRDELRQALQFVYCDYVKFRDLYFKTLDEKDKFIMEFLNGRISDFKKLFVNK